MKNIFLLKPTDGQGFYITKRFQVAADFAQDSSGRNNCVVLLVFTIERELLDRYDGYDLFADEDLCDM